MALDPSPSLGDGDGAAQQPSPISPSNPSPTQPAIDPAPSEADLPRHVEFQPVAAPVSPAPVDVRKDERLGEKQPLLPAFPSLPPPASPSDEAEVELVDWGDDDDDDTDEDEDEALLAGLEADSPATKLKTSEAILGDEELVDWGEESPAYGAPSPNSSAEDGEAAGHPMSATSDADGCCCGVPSTDALPKPMAAAVGHGGTNSPIVPRTLKLARAGGTVLNITEQEEPASPGWQRVKAGRQKRTDTGTFKAAPRGPPPAALAAFKKQFIGRCFRCLASDHQVAECRDPVRCISCWKVGHLSRSCPSRRPRIVSDQLRARLKFPPGSIHSRIIFPPLPHHDHTSPAKTEMAHVWGASHQRFACHHRVQAHAAGTPSPPDGHRANVSKVAVASAPATPGTPEIADALSHHLQVPRHNIFVSSHRPGVFVVEFMPVATTTTPATNLMLLEPDCRAFLPTVSPSYGPDDSGKDTHSSESLLHEKPAASHEKGHKEMAQGTEIELPDLTATLENDDQALVELHGAEGVDGRTEPTLRAAAGTQPNIQLQEDTQVVDEGEDSDDHEPVEMASQDGCATLCSSTFKNATTPQLQKSAPSQHRGKAEPDRAEDLCSDFCSSMFKSVPEPLLPRPTSSPTSPPKRVYSRRKRKNMVATRSSVRLAARPSTVPVAERATRKLMRELDFVNKRPSAPDAAITAYLDTCTDDLPEQAIKAIRAATRLDNKELTEALAAIAQGTEGLEMEVP